MLEKNYNVYGVHRRSSTTNFQRIQHLVDNSNFYTVEGDITDPISVSGIISDVQPDECYNLAAMSHVATSFEQPVYTSLVNYMGVQYILDSIVKYSPQTKFYQASTSECFGDNYSTELNGIKYQDEQTALSPLSPYAVAKTAAHNLVYNYRKAYDIFACSGLLFNHESCRRGDNFVTRKITKWIGEFYKWSDGLACLNMHEQGFGMCEALEFQSKHTDRIYRSNLDNKGFPKLRLGNLDASRDWGHSKEYVKVMWMMLQQDKPEEYVIATGKTYSIRQFLDVAFKEVGINDWYNYVVVDPKFYRPSDVEYLLGDASKAKRELGWEPKVKFKELVKIMMEYELKIKIK